MNKHLEIARELCRLFGEDYKQVRSITVEAVYGEVCVVSVVRIADDDDLARLRACGPLAKKGELTNGH